MGAVRLQFTGLPFRSNNFKKKEKKKKRRGEGGRRDSDAYLRTDEEVAGSNLPGSRS